MTVADVTIYLDRHTERESWDKPRQLKYYNTMGLPALQVEIDHEYKGHVYLSPEDAVDLAVKIIRDQGREDLLAAEPAPKKLAERVGEYFRHREDKYDVVRIVGPTKFTLTESYDAASAVNAKGETISINNEVDVDDWWIPVEVQIVPASPEKWVAVDA